LKKNKASLSSKAATSNRKDGGMIEGPGLTGPDARLVYAAFLGSAINGLA
jgi:hypothetical protein